MSMPMHEVRATVREFLLGTTPEVLAISGRWGVGKTHLWKSMLNDARNSNTLGYRSYGYVSLFGLSNLDALKLGLFESTKMLAPAHTSNGFLSKSVNGLKTRAKVWRDLGARAFGRQLTTDLIGGARIGQRVAQVMPPSIANISKALSPLYFAAVHDQIVCIDDIERRDDGLKLNEVLGLVSYLKEERDCRVVLLLNSDSLAEADKKLFETYLEKVVDVDITMSPESREAIDIAFDGWDDVVARQVREKALALDIRNVRVLRRIIRLTKQATRHFQNFDPLVTTRAVFILTLTGWTIFEPAAAPKQWLNDMVQTTTSTDDWGDGDPADEDHKPSAEQETMTRYGFSYFDKFDLKLIAEAQRGYFDPLLLQELGAELQREINTLQSSETLREAWSIAFDSFEDNEDAVVDVIFKTTCECKAFASISDLNKAVGLLVAVKRTKLAEQVVQIYEIARGGDAKFWDTQDAWAMGPLEPVISFVIDAKRQKVGDFSPAESLIRIGERRATSKDDTKLAAWGAENLKHLILEARGQHMRDLVTSSLQYASLGNPNETQQAVLSHARTALAEIAESSPLNAWRVSRYSGVRRNS